MNGDTIRSIIKQSYNNRLFCQDDYAVGLKGSPACQNDALNFRASISPNQLSPYKMNRKNSLSMTAGLCELGSLIQSKDKNTYSYIQTSASSQFQKTMSPKYTKARLFSPQSIIFDQPEKYKSSTVIKKDIRSPNFKNLGISSLKPRLTQQFSLAKFTKKNRCSDLSYLKKSSVFSHLQSKALKQKGQNSIHRSCVEIETGVALLSKGSININEFKSLLKWNNVPIDDILVQRKLKQFENGSTTNYNSLLSFCMKMINEKSMSESNLKFRRIETSVFKHCKPLANNCSIITKSDHILPLPNKRHLTSSKEDTIKSQLVWDNSKQNKNDFDKVSPDKDLHLRWSSQASNTFYYSSNLFSDIPLTPIRESFSRLFENNILKRSFQQRETRIDRTSTTPSTPTANRSESLKEFPRYSSLSKQHPKKRFKSVSTSEWKKLSGYALSTNMASPCESLKQSIEIRCN